MSNNCHVGQRWWNIVFSYNANGHGFDPIETEAGNVQILVKFL